MNCTEVFNYIFESFNSNNIDYAIIHSYQYLPDRFDSDIDTGKLYQLPVPFVWGPIGGGQFYNPIFKDAYFSRKDINKEKLRNFINRFYLIFSSDIKAAVKKANTILIADQSTESIMPKSRKYVRLLETGYDLKRNEVKDYDEDLTINKKRPIRLLWVGGIWPRKGLKVLIDLICIQG